MNDPITPDRNPIRLLTAGYILALVIIALMSGFIHVFLTKISEQQNSPAVFLSSRQAKTAQEIALYATIYVEDRNQAALREMSSAIEMMESSHRNFLSNGDSIEVSATLPEPVARIFFAQPFSLDEKMKDFIGQARALAAANPGTLSPSNTHYRRVIDSAQGTFRSALDAAVTAWEEHNLRQIELFQSYQRYALFVIFLTLLAEALFIFMPLVRRVNAYAERLRQLATTDGLTGVDNYRSFMQKGARELRRSQRIGKPLCVCLIDIDHFKSVNDQYGHATGDFVLQKFAEILKKGMRLEDELGRVGGEEFGILLPHTRLADALRVAERIRKMAELSPIRCEGAGDLFVTASFGVAEANPKSPTLEHVMTLADEALYKAKQNGRNRVEINEAFCSDPGAVVLPLEQKSTA